MLAALLLAGACRAPAAPRTDAGRPCPVARVSDGDSLTCEGGERVRLLLVDAPELAQGPFGDLARRALLELTPPGGTVRLELDREERDRFGRTLAYAWTADGRMVNEELARRGFVVELVYAPNERYVNRIRGAVESARRAGRGLWAEWGFACRPVDFRAERCR